MKKVLKRIAIALIVIVAAFIAWTIYGTVNYNRNGIEYVVNDANERKINYYIGDEVTKKAPALKNTDTLNILTANCQTIHTNRSKMQLPMRRS